MTARITEAGGGGAEEPPGGAGGLAPPVAGIGLLAETLPGFSGDQSPQALACGDSMARLLESVGGPPGHRAGAGIGVTAAPMPGGTQ